MGVGKFSTSTESVAVDVNAQNNSGGIVVKTEDGFGIQALTNTSLAIRAQSDSAEGLVADSESGIGIAAASTSNIAMFAFSEGSHAVVAQSDSDVALVGNGTEGGVIGLSDMGTGVDGESIGGFGVYGFSENTDSIVGDKFDDTGAAGSFSNATFTLFTREFRDAGRFMGNVKVFGNLSVSGIKGFRIDHPLEPKSKWLNHAAVESVVMKNFYDGVATLDSLGEAVVRLPKWFEALNKDYCYQLTALGAPAPNLHVAKRLANSTFKIAGGRSGAKVSWQVTATRQDAWAKANPFQVEELKSRKERGHLIWPKVKRGTKKALASILSPELHGALREESPSRVKRSGHGNGASKLLRGKRKKRLRS